MVDNPLKLMVLSGRSGSGKSTALRILEDLGYHCIDNLPAGFLPDLVERTRSTPALVERGLAVSIDARNLPEDLQRLPQLLRDLAEDDIEVELLFLDATTDSLVTRYSETRRRHPLTTSARGLREALFHEKELLDEIADMAALQIDTTRLDQSELQRLVKRMANRRERGSDLLFRSFAYKRGVPIDADYVFDLRCLPNPYWDSDLRAQNGKDQPVIDFLNAQPEVTRMFDDLHRFISHWLPLHEVAGRSYVTIALGCTGGQHRSVYMAERLAHAFDAVNDHVLVRHRELDA